MSGDGSVPGAVLETRLTGLLGVRHPVLNAPMGDTAGGRLAAAVSSAGGLGLIGGGYGDPAWLERELAIAGDARVGVGFVVFALSGRDATLRTALDAHPVAVQLSFGDPRPHAEAVHAAGALLLCGVSSAEEVDQALDAGADALVVQGSDAGGHGRRGPSTSALLPSIRDRVGEMPLVSAGGIGDGRGLVAALALGADGVSMGTRFLATTESIAAPAELRSVVTASAADTVRTDVFDVVRGPAWPEGHDGRVVRNHLVDEWESGCGVDRAAATFAAAGEGDVSALPVWAGESVGVVHEVGRTADVMEEIMRAVVQTSERLQSMHVHVGAAVGASR